MVEGVVGEAPDRTIVVATPEEAERVQVPDPTKVGVVTQTTLSVDDTREIVEALRRRFPQLSEPRKDDICYATTNRQDAVKVIAEQAELVLVIGAANSSNSVRLKEVAERSGAHAAFLIASAENIDWRWFDGVKTLGLTAGASAPESLVQGVIAACRARFEVSAQEIVTAQEDVVFRIPRVLEEA